MAKPASLENLPIEQVENMAATYNALLANPETRDLVLGATKKVFPNVSIPEYDLRKRQDDELKSRDDRINELMAKQLQAEAEQRVRDERDLLRGKGYSAEAIAAIEKVMMEKKIQTYEVAAEFYDAQNRIAEPTPGTTLSDRPTSFSLPPNPLEAVKQGRHGLRDWSRNESAAAIDDLRAGRVKLVH